jgi:transcriptional regulator with XRE-family HTH domain
MPPIIPHPYIDPIRLRALRRRRRLSQAEAARRWGCCARSWRRYEAGERLLEADWPALERAMASP